MSRRGGERTGKEADKSKRGMDDDRRREVEDGNRKRGEQVSMER